MESTPVGGKQLACFEVGVGLPDEVAAESSAGLLGAIEIQVEFFILEDFAVPSEDGVATNPQIRIGGSQDFGSFVQHFFEKLVSLRHGHGASLTKDSTVGTCQPRAQGGRVPIEGGGLLQVFGGVPKKPVLVGVEEFDVSLRRPVLRMKNELEHVLAFVLAALERLEGWLFGQIEKQRGIGQADGEAGLTDRSRPHGTGARHIVDPTIAGDTSTCF